MKYQMVSGYAPWAFAEESPPGPVDAWNAQKANMWLWNAVGRLLRQQFRQPRTKVRYTAALCSA